MMKSSLAALLIFAIPTFVIADEKIRPIRVGSKAFTENAILGEMVRQLLIDANIPATHKELGGTQVVWKAMLAGQIDVYPEYTGTIAKEILVRAGLHDENAIRAELEKYGIRMSRPLGFSNTYVIGMTQEVASRLGIKRISDLRDHPSLRLGFSNEFCEREDGWPSLRRYYALPHQDVRGLEHDLAYRALNNDQVQVTDFYSTDGKLTRYKFVSLEDDAGYFPRYDAVLLYRAELETRRPEAIKAFSRLEGELDEKTMISLNARADLDGKQASQVAAEYLQKKFNIERPPEVDSPFAILLRNTLRHLQLVTVSLLMAIVAAIPLGILAVRWPRVGQGILSSVGLIQTIPSIVLLVLFIPLLGVEGRPAIAALFLYSLLPIVRNTHAGLKEIPPSLLESADAIGLRPWPRLLRIELPLASRSILAGIKTAAVINVGTATLGGFIGAGGYGQPIFQGLRSDNWNFMVWQGAIPTAVMSLAVLGFFEIIERKLVPRGLRLPKQKP